MVVSLARRYEKEPGSRKRASNVQKRLVKQGAHGLPHFRVG